ncbi:MAG: VWA domain-containing protein [Bacillus subtilis]|nr:VWA domain-containing protein [Bacillus subtilis]
MKKGLTELVFILDRSGSMRGLEADTIGGFNAMLAKQIRGEGEVIVSTVLFDDRFEVLHNRLPIQAVAPMTPREYFVRGSTALLDAIGRSIAKIANIQQILPASEQAEKVLFVITTDGMENASREYNYDHLKLIIERQQEKYGWEFLFLGANIDATATAGKFGIRAERTRKLPSRQSRNPTQLRRSQRNDHELPQVEENRRSLESSHRCGLFQPIKIKTKAVRFERL